MANFRVRTFKLSTDFWQVFKIYYKVWFCIDLPKLTLINYLCTLNYVLDTLKHGFTVLCAVDQNDKVGGIAILADPKRPSMFKSKLLQALFAIISWVSHFLLYVLPHSQTSRLIEERYIANYNRLQKFAPQDLAELKILIVSPEYKGHGLGKLLITKAQEVFKLLKYKGYYLLTDSGCDYQFYNHLKMEQTANIKMNFAPDLASEQKYFLQCMVYTKNF